MVSKVDECRGDQATSMHKVAKSPATRARAIGGHLPTKCPSTLT